MTPGKKHEVLTDETTPQSLAQGLTVSRGQESTLRIRSILPLHYLPDITLEDLPMFEVTTLRYFIDWREPLSDLAMMKEPVPIAQTKFIAMYRVIRRETESPENTERSFMSTSIMGFVRAGDHMDDGVPLVVACVDESAQTMRPIGRQNPRRISRVSLNLMSVPTWIAMFSDDVSWRSGYHYNIRSAATRLHVTLELLYCPLDQLHDTTASVAPNALTDVPESTHLRRQEYMTRLTMTAANWIVASSL
ncbi:hypothetical protein C8Q74DRAFT_1442487 [Fomes fomentarius]|nr:hypothetical protein C8Q74DRAFT_1442487 [Fomes fomentarius]